MTKQHLEVPEQVKAEPALLSHALLEGGHLTVSVRNPGTGRHVSLVLVVRKRNPSGQGYVARNTAAGRVGLADGDVIEARDPDLEYPENYIGRFYKDGAAWRPGRTADRARAWTAEKVIGLALGTVPPFESAEVFIATRCIVCSRQLRHPESVAELIGPECSGRRRRGRAARRSTLAAGAAVVGGYSLDGLSQEQLGDLYDSARAAAYEPDASPEVRREMEALMSRIAFKQAAAV